MRKYPAGHSVGAIYDNAPADNPFLAAMPEMVGREEFLAEVNGSPPIPHNIGTMTSEERRQALPILSTVFISMDYMYAIYDQLYRAIRTTYTARTVIDGTRQTNAIFQGLGAAFFVAQADTGSILGVPGIGKTVTVQRSLGLLPQVIEHTEYQGHPFFCKQVLYLRVECPSDCSIKTLAFNILAALDRAIASDYLNRLTLMKSISVSAIATQVKILCMTHHVGLILVDEIQNAVLTARKNRQVKPLIKFLVELTNDTGTATYFVGTPEAEELFISQEHLKRRTRGIRLLPLKPDGAYRSFLEQLWPYQLTPSSAPLTEKIANKLYDHSAGIPAYIVKIFREAQVQALLNGDGCISERMIQRAVEILAIKVPKTFAGGTHISDFSFGEDGDGITPILLPTDGGEQPEQPRLYANKRGRPVSVRDERDLLNANGPIQTHLRKYELLEEWPLC